VYIGSTLAGTWDWNFIAGNRYNVTTTRSGNALTIFINGTQLGSTFTNSTSVTKNSYFIGKYAGGEIINGSMDEVRIYNRALSASEVQLLYYSNLNKYDTDKWLFTDYKQCTLLDGSHSFTGYSSDIAGNTQSIQRSITTTIPNYNSLAPNGFALGSTSVTKVGKSLLGQFDDYFEFVDRKGNTGWTTTIQLPLQMRGQRYGLAISGTNVYFKAAGIDTIQGISTSNVYVTGSLSSYNSF
jgi:hypothetical protein